MFDNYSRVTRPFACSEPVRSLLDLSKAFLHPVDMTSDRLQRLADAVKTRRAELGLAQGDLAQHGGPSIVTVGQIERGQIERPQAVTLSRLDKALGWEKGSSARVLAGGEPTTAGNGSVRPDVEGAEPYLTRREGPDLSSATIDELLEEVARRARAANPDAQR